MEWINIKNEMPIKEDNYLCTFEYEGKRNVDIFFFDGENFYEVSDFGDLFNYDEYIVAWMPLPKPYEE